MSLVQQSLLLHFLLHTAVPTTDNRFYYTSYTPSYIAVPTTDNIFYYTSFYTAVPTTDNRFYYTSSYTLLFLQQIIYSTTHPSTVHSACNLMLIIFKRSDIIISPANTVWMSANMKNVSANMWRRSANILSCWNCQLKYIGVFAGLHSSAVVPLPPLSGAAAEQWASPQPRPGSPASAKLRQKPFYQSEKTLIILEKYRGANSH